MIRWFCSEVEKVARYCGRTALAFVITVVATVFLIGSCAIAAVVYVYFNSHLDIQIYHMAQGEFRTIDFK